jgi:AcrR family transcriptional regulator
MFIILNMVHTGAVARRQRQREALTAEIQEAARAIFVRDGYQGFSMRKLATRVGYSPAAIYLYVQSKAGLFGGLVEESFQRLSESLAGLADSPHADPIERLKRGLRVYVDWGASHPHDYQLAFLLPNPAGGPYKTHQAFDVLRAMVTACIPAHKAQRRRAETASQAIWASVHGMTSLLIQRPTFRWTTREAVIRQVIDSAVDGAIARARRRQTRGERHGRT